MTPHILTILPRLTLALILLPLLSGCATPTQASPIAPHNLATTTTATAMVPTTTAAATEATTTTASPWQRSNPGAGGWFATVKAGPDGMILAASDLSGFYRSQDRGATWDVIGAAQGLKTTHASGIGFHPTDPDIILLGTEEGIYFSDNRGDSVQQVLSDGYITDLALSSDDPNVGYAAYHSVWDLADGQVYKTTDGGRTWSQVSVNLPGGLRILKLVLDPGDVNTLYLFSGEGRFATGPAHAFRSTNGGVHWTRIASSLGDVMDVAVSPDIAGRVYLTTYDSDPDGPGYLYRSDDDGASWTQLAHRGGRIWLQPDEPNTIRLIDPFNQFPWDDRNGVWESVDGGATWTQVSKVEDWDMGWTEAYWAYTSDVRAIGDDLSDPEWLHIANSQFIFATDDRGRTFFNNYTTEVAPGRWQSHGVDNVVMFHLAMSETEPQHIYTGFFDLGCWHSPDGGASWMNCNDYDASGDWEGSGGNVTALAVDPARNGVVWTAQAQSWDEPGHLLKSSDYGDTWPQEGAGLPALPLSGLSLDRASPANQRTLFLTADGDVYRSEDDGATWSKVFDCNGCRVTAVDAFHGRVVYAGGEEGFWRSTQGGDAGTWQEVGLPEMHGSIHDEVWEWGWEGVFAITPDPHVANRVYAAVMGEGKGLYRSNDAGTTWAKLWSDNYLRDVAVSPVDAGILFAASSSAFMAGGYEPDSHGVLLSTDGGATWTTQNAGMAWPFAIVIAFDPGNPNHVWVGSPGTGFQHRTFDFATTTYLPLITISQTNAIDLRLSWQHDPAYTFYEVYRDFSPYFQPSGSPQAVIDAYPWQFDDPNAVGDPAQNRYYLTKGASPTGATFSNRVGEFDFGLTPGGG